MKKIAGFLLFGILVGAACLQLAAAEEAEVRSVFESSKDRVIEISVVETDDAGETSFSKQMVQIDYWFKTGRRTVDQKVDKLAFYHLDRTLDLQLHPAPRIQFLLILKGILQIETTNGDVRQFPAGSIFLVTDTKASGSRGHKSKVIGSEDVLAVVASVPGGIDTAKLFER